MKLADLQKAMALQAALQRLDDLPVGVATMQIGHQDFALSADELAGFVEWRRGQLHRQLRGLGITPDGADTATEIPAIQADNPRAKTTAAGQSDPAAAGLSREAATERVTAELMADYRGMLQRGLIDQAQYDERLAQRSERIRERVAELLRPYVPPPLCEDCDQVSTTLVAGRALCDQHARGAARLELPQAAGAA